MLLNTATLAILLSPAALAYQIPTGTEDGIYSVSFDEAGNPSVEQHDVDVKNLARRTTGVKLDRREDFPWPYESSCTEHQIDDQDSYNQASQALGAWLDGTWTVQPHKIVYSTIGGSVLAVCNYADGNQPGSSHEIALLNGVLDSSCGNWRSGYLWQKFWNKTYWRTTADAKSEICTNI